MAGGSRAVRVVAWVVTAVFVVAMVAFSVLRIGEVVGSESGVAADAFGQRYIDHPLLTYAHIGPGLVFVLLAPLQLSKRLRRRSLAMHRSIGRVAATAGLVSAVFGIVFGLALPWGGFAEGSASLVFGAYMLVAIVLAVVRIRDGDRSAHRRWMIRAVAAALGVATIRVILSLGEALDVLTFDEAFGWAFWAGFCLNVAVAEWWVARWPTPTRRQLSPSVT